MFEEQVCVCESCLSNAFPFLSFPFLSFASPPLCIFLLILLLCSFQRWPLYLHRELRVLPHSFLTLSLCCLTGFCVVLQSQRSDPSPHSASLACQRRQRSHPWPQRQTRTLSGKTPSRPSQPSPQNPSQQVRSSISRENHMHAARGGGDPERWEGAQRGGAKRRSNRRSKTGRGEMGNKGCRMPTKIHLSPALPRSHATSCLVALLCSFSSVGHGCWQRQEA